MIHPQSFSQSGPAENARFAQQKQPDPAYTLSLLLSILIPVYNERTVVERSLRQVLDAPLPDDLERELIVVDDCSKDGTYSILERLAEEDSRIRLFRHPVNRGKGAAIRSALEYAGGLAASAASAKAAGIKPIPQVEVANKLGASIGDLQKHRVALGKVIDKAEGMHDALEKQAELLTSDGADAMADVRRCCDELELSVSDEMWPLPKYREMLFPV